MLCEEKSPQIAEVAKNGGWPRLWDIALDLGERHMHQMPANGFKTHGQGRKPCPLCEDVNLDAPVLDHVLEQHMNRRSISGTDALDKLIAGDIQFVYMFRNVYVF